VARAVEKALQVHPDERYQTMAEFAAALRAASITSRPTLVRALPFVDAQPPAPPAPAKATVAAPKSEPVRMPSAPDRRKAWPLLLVAILGVLAVFGAFTLVPAVSGLFGGDRSTPSEASSPAVRPSPTLAQALIVPTLPPTLSPESTDTSVAVIPTSGATPVGGGVGELVFASTREGASQIYLVNFDGSDPRRLTDLADGACQPAWSPDGQRLAFTSPCIANREVLPGAQIFIMNADGSNLEPLPTVPGGDFDPAWSPDGRRIAFTSLRDRHAQIYVIDVESKVISNLSSNLAAEMQPAWSPTGAELLFTGERTDSLDIWIMPEQGGSSKRFTRGGEDTHPDWGSTGSLIIFTQRIDGVSRLVATTYESDGLIGNRVCPSGEQAGYPMAEARLSPDQSWIAFETWPSGSNHEIAVMSLNCTNFRYLTDDPGLDFDPAWRP
jgi:dipeptidyl aminopeptidase/acylaminoacyl peptidase